MLIHERALDRAEKVLHQIAACHNGTLNDSRFGVRGRGDGTIAKQIHDLVRLARHLYFKDKVFPKLNHDLHLPYKDGQTRLF